MPLIKYESHRFRDRSLATIEHANTLIADYAAQGLSLTLRQLYYRFVASDLLPNTSRSYSNLGALVSRARLAGLMDWNAIEDRGRSLLALSHWDDPSDVIHSAAYSFRFDKWANQRNRVEVWVEKQALESVVGQAAKPFDCAYFSCKGYTSQSAMWRAARRFESYLKAGQTPVIIHLGDHDPSGVDMTRDIFERLNELFGVEVEVDRIALNMSQIREHRPPPNPAKVTDSRAKQYIRVHGRQSWELDALEPSTLREMISSSIRERMDSEMWAESLQEEEIARRSLFKAAERWSEVENFLGEK